jgi:hypothetical protein
VRTSTIIYLAMTLDLPTWVHKAIDKNVISGEVTRKQKVVIALLPGIGYASQLRWEALVS